MDEQEDYELLPRRQVEHLRKELENLKANPFVKSHQGDKLFVSVNKLTDSVDKLYSLFENVNEEIVKDFEEKTEGSDDKLQSIIEQNKHIAEGILSMADKLAEHEKHIKNIVGHKQIDHTKEREALVAEFEMEEKPEEKPADSSLKTAPRTQGTDNTPDVATPSQKYNIDNHIDSIGDHLDEEIDEMHTYTANLNQSPQTNHQIPPQNVELPRQITPTPLNLHNEAPVNQQPPMQRPVLQQQSQQPMNQNTNFQQHQINQNSVNQPVSQRPEMPRIQKPTFEQRPRTGNLPYPISQPSPAPNQMPQNTTPVDNRQYRPAPEQLPQQPQNAPPNISRSMPIQNNFNPQQAPLNEPISPVPPPPNQSSNEFINPNFPTSESMPAQTNAQPEMLAPINPEPRKKKKFLGFM